MILSAQLTPRLLSVEQAAHYLGLSPKTLRNRLSRGALDPFPIRPRRIGRRVLFDLRDLEVFVDSLKDEGE
jgi:excisionase family DNA binding protein